MTWQKENLVGSLLIFKGEDCFNFISCLFFKGIKFRK